MTMPLNLTPQPQPDQTQTAQAVVTEQNTPLAKTEADPKVKSRNVKFRQYIDSCKSYRRKLIFNWIASIDVRRGKGLASQPDDDTIVVNLDWPMTKAKQAALFSQVPKVRIDHQPQSLAPWVPTYEQRLNDILVTAGIESTMDECLPDCINAAGFGTALVSYESLTEDVSIPVSDPLSTTPTAPAGATTAVPRVLDKRYVVQRISPADFLWPLSFTSSNFDNAPWLGRSGRITWTDAMQKFNLKESDKQRATGEDRQTLDRLSHDVEKDKLADDMVSFDEIFYKDFQYDSTARSYTTIHHLVFVDGITDPVIDEPWKGQKTDADGAISGSLKFPIRVLTLTYISDETIPPSDSAVSRPQVNEINKSRTQMIRQRERSLPVRWFDVNRVDPLISQALMRGTWQNMIPVQGEGSRVIGEVARAAMPQENFAFDKIAKNDLNEITGVGPNQDGGGANIDTAAEANVIQSNFQLRIGRERAKVAAFVVGIAEVLGGLMCLYEDPTSFGEGFDPGIGKGLSYSILADSTVLVDSNQKLQRLSQFINMYGKSGWIDLAPVLKEIATLTGLDPNTVVKEPQPKPPVEPNISLRLTGAEDMMNPLMLAFMLKSGQAPPPELIEQAKQLIQQSVVIQQPPPTPGVPPGTPPVVPGPTPGTPVPPPAPPGVGEANPQMTVMPKVVDRSESGQGGIS